MKYKIYTSEFVAWANSYEGKKFHAVLCDPPYGLAFMNQQWDSHQNFDKVVKKWGKALRKLLYPGALVFMFGGTRTWHRLAVGMEDAEFELWDTIMWLHGQGFPKAQAIDRLIDKMNGDERIVVGKKKKSSPLPGNHAGTWADGQEDGIFDVTSAATKISKAWEGMKTCALKPAWEPILCFRAPDNGKTYAELAMKYGSGCLNVDKGRIGKGKGGIAPKQIPNYKNNVYGKGMGGADWDNTKGRYPANLCLDKKSARMLDEQTGKRPAAGLYRKECETPSSFTGKRDGFGYGDIGGASRFFYTAKAPKYERNEGLEFFTPHQCGIGALRDSGRGKIATNVHPTVKPISLNKWLAAMLLPAESVKRRRLLVPFSGSGSEMIGALRAGWDKVIGVEMNKDYCRIAKSRLKYWKKYKPVWKNLI